MAQLMAQLQGESLALTVSWVDGADEWGVRRHNSSRLWMGLNAGESLALNLGWTVPRSRNCRDIGVRGVGKFT